MFSGCRSKKLADLNKEVVGQQGQGGGQQGQGGGQQEQESGQDDQVPGHQLEL